MSTGLGRYFNFFDMVRSGRTYLRMRRSLNNQERTSDMLPFLWEWEERRDKFAEWDRLYTNARYTPQAEGGDLEVVLRQLLGKDCKRDLDGWYNPVAAIVDAYQSVLYGDWGSTLWPVDANDVGAAIDRKSPLYDALTNLWRWSNFDTQKQLLQTYAPLYGTVGLRISARDDADPIKRRVRMHIVHPGEIVDYDDDVDGNITSVRLERIETFGPLGEERKTRRVTEILSKESFSVQYGDDSPVVTPNELGVCPFVLIPHRDIGERWGANAFLGSERNIDRINYRLSREDRALDQNQFPIWYAAGDGDKPTRLDLSGNSFLYSRTSGTGSAVIEPLTADLDHSSVAAYVDARIAHLVQRHPELVLYNIDALSGQSGETIAKLLKPVEQRLRMARGMYEHGLRKAMQIGLSWSVMLSLVDLGHGMGTMEAAERSYQSGDEDFAFNSRPALPADAYEIMQTAKANLAVPNEQASLAIKRAALSGVSQEEVLRTAGYSDDQIKTMATETQPTDGEDERS